ncbi:alternative ribosome rescue aminoacyl-tRNA hydrolase ArfB [Adhaeribacter rhizoryzae]|uniref:Aminoacyl-tRNA hydrolase n=1 Tax=Adhaeribacter rhizoryzae TaxID=2607907 RepID=A0A5M6DNZ3_9BACT|nr:alternative ribosome rescue aminoacyl-tRNA hydrolase ArfB [Adhaeribacter rhizoryzae]KAA5549227.1 aminoacyl-tRNA hydrolase [Adhaeribacter rhizoryzae]
MIDFTKEFEYRTSRSGGPGGQNVNKVSSKVELRFHVNNSELLTEEEKALLYQKLGNYITQEGYLQVICQTERSQLANKENCIQKFYALLGKAFTKQKARKPTKPSKASQHERIAAKKKLSDKKANRGRVRNSDY